MANFASAARNAPSEDGKCWQRVELGIPWPEKLRPQLV